MSNVKKKGKKKLYDELELESAIFSKICDFFKNLFFPSAVL